MHYYLPILRILFLIGLITIQGSSNPVETVEQSYVKDGKRYFATSVVPYESLLLEGAGSEAKQVILEALRVRSETSWPRYIFGSADPEQGGFDCSGAIHYVLRRSGYNPPRTSSSQYLWLQEKGKIQKVSPEATSIDHHDYKKLRPGDLVFWSGTYEPTDGRTTPVTHVGMYIGYMKDYERPLMICSSKGRSFNGLRCDGYGVYDFKIPSATSRAKIVGYGPLPKL